jgi:hypothetical protein
MAIDPARMLRGAFAGGIAAAAWAAQQPVDKRAFGGGYDDVELLGRAFLPRAPKRRWYPLGLALHVQNGAAFGAVYAGLLAPRLPLPAALRGTLVAQAENFGLWPLGRLSDRFHPARGELTRLAGNRRALAQATWRHLLFGLLLGVLEGPLNAGAAPARGARPAVGRARGRAGAPAREPGRPGWRARVGGAGLAGRGPRGAPGWAWGTPVDPFDRGKYPLHGTY